MKSNSNTAFLRACGRFLLLLWVLLASGAVLAQTADLAVTKSVSNPAPNVGDTISFTVTVTNNGPDVATTVSVQDLLPAGLAFVSATPSQGTYNSGTGAWDIGTVTTVTPQTLVIQVTVASPAAQTNTATISHSDQPDSNTGNNSGSATETPQQADLALTKTVNNSTPNVGDTITFTVTLTNNGPNPATNVTVQDLLPAGLTFVSATPSQGTYNSGTGTWTVGTVTTVTPQTLTLQATVASAVAQTNTATISHSDQFDPNAGNNSASATETPQRADLALSKIASTPTPPSGASFTWTVTVTNNGPDAATNVTVQDTLPAGVAFVSAVPSQGSYNNGTGLWTIGTIASGANATLTLTVTAGPSASVTNTASVSHSDQFDPNAGNNSASSTVTIQSGTADLALTKTVNNPTPNVGDTITFTVTLQNLGPNTAAAVSVTDLLPAGLAFVSATPSQGTYNSGTGTWTVGTVTTATAQTLAIQATVVSPAPATNTATISVSGAFDPVAGNNSASATETPQQAELAVSKSSSTPTTASGANFTWTVTLANNGPNAATNVTLQDALPAGVTFVSATPSQGSYNSGTGVWTIGTIASAANATLTLTVTAGPAATVTNTASVSHSDQFDPNAGNNSASSPVTITSGQADLALTKTVSNAAPNVGDTITFTVTLTNGGPSTATNVTVQDVLPAGLAFVSATPSQGTYNSGTGSWTVGTVPTASPQTLTIQATVVSSSAATNTATISHSDQFDPTAANNSASATETPQQADLALSKTASTTTPPSGASFTWTVTVSNNGPNTATNVTVQDTLPAGVAFVSAIPSQGTYNSATGVWTIGTIASGATATLTLTVTGGASTAVTNTASVSHSDQFDPNAANNSASSSVTSGPSAPIPALSELMLMLLAVLLMALGAMRLRANASRRPHR